MRMIIHAPDQIWTKEFLREIKDKYQIIYDGKGIFAIRFIEDGSECVELMEEKGGSLEGTGVYFHRDWLESFIDVLKMVNEKCIKRGYKRRHYAVDVVETYKRTIYVAAESEEDAYEKVDKAIEDGAIESPHMNGDYSYERELY